MRRVAENQVLEWRSTVGGCRNSGKKYVLHADTLFLWFSSDMAFDIPHPVN